MTEQESESFLLLPPLSAQTRLWAALLQWERQLDAHTPTHKRTHVTTSAADGEQASLELRSRLQTDTHASTHSSDGGSGVAAVLVAYAAVSLPALCVSLRAFARVYGLYPDSLREAFYARVQHARVCHVIFFVVILLSFCLVEMLCVYVSVCTSIVVCVDGCCCRLRL